MSLRDWLQSSYSSESSKVFKVLARLLATSASSGPMGKQKSADANDLGVDDPKQGRLRAYPVSVFGAKKRRFNAAWYQRWDRLEYSVKFGAVFCFPCRNFESKAGGNF